MIVIDSDVLLLAFAFTNDSRQEKNQAFLESMQTAQPAITIYNVMEVLGQLSFNLSAEQLDQWQSWLVDAYQLIVIWMADERLKMGRESFYEELYERPYQKNAFCPYALSGRIDSFTRGTRAGCGMFCDLEREAFQRENTFDGFNTRRISCAVAPFIVPDPFSNYA